MTTPSRYWREIPQRYRLEASMCTECRKTFFPPRLVCPDCKGQKFEKTRLAEAGKVLTYTVIHVPPQGFGDQTPYAVGIVELDDGVKLTAQIVDCDFEDIQIGQRVKIEFRKVFSGSEAGILCYGYKFVPE